MGSVRAEGRMRRHGRPRRERSEEIHESVKACERAGGSTHLLVDCCPVAEDIPAPNEAREEGICVALLVPIELAL